MFTLKFQTNQYRPDHLITLRTNIQNWQEDIAGNYEGDSWVFILPDDLYQNGFNFKFILEEQYWMEGNDLFLQPNPGQEYVFNEFDVVFPAQTEIVTENGVIPRRFFFPNLDQTKVYDVIVVGSGVGGGILADQLADLGQDVLVLEAGSYLFPTHVGNLPRQHFLMKGVDKNIWGLWDDFKVTNYTNQMGSQYFGGQGFNLGGRSIFWGGLIPEMKAYEFDGIWPQAVRDYILTEGYAQAHGLMQKAQVDSPYQREALDFLSTHFSEYDSFTAPLAISHTDPNRRNIGSGVFSTADLLMESRLSQGISGNANLTVNLNHAVNLVETEGDRAVAVHATDLISGEGKRYQGNTIVLAAGTVESAKIAQLSNLNAPNGKIGQGITDHPIFFTHFALPNDAPMFRRDTAAKLLMQHHNARVEPDNQYHHRYNVVVELGTDFNQGRFVDPDLAKAHWEAKGDFMLCEIVFLFHSPLVEENTLTQLGPAFVKPNIFMQAAPISQAEWDEINGLKNAVIQQLGGVAIEGQNLDLLTAGLGGVAHEVGTLRMGDQGVVDENLKFHGYQNLYACDLSVFPTSPAANPTLTLGALALRLAQHLVPGAQTALRTRGFNLIEPIEPTPNLDDAMRNLYSR